jgi:hypothetical protein
MLDGSVATLEPGQSVWYAFGYVGDDSPVQASISVLQGSNTDFSVWTPEEVQAREAGQQVDPVGRGTTNLDGSGDPSWVGSFIEAGNYYLMVENDSAAPASFILNLGGDGVRTPVIGQGNNSGESNVPQATPPVQPVAQMGDSPEHALVPTGDPVTVAPNQTIWYAFQYVGDASEIQAWINEISGNATFSVWTPEEISQYEAGQAVDPVGRGTVSAYGPGDLSWVGSFIEANTYYLKVENSSGAPATAAIHVSGDGVRLPAAQPQG